MLTRETVIRISRIVHQVPQLAGVRVGLYSGGVCRVAHPGNPTAPDYARRSVIIEEALMSGIQVTSSANDSNAAGGLQSATTYLRNHSALDRELVGSAVSCGNALLSAVTMAGAGAATAGSGGALAPLAGWIFAASAVSLVTNTFSCTNALTRAGLAYFRPDDNSLQQLDSDPAYLWTTFIVDAVGVLASIVSLGSLSTTARSIVSLVRLRGGMVSMERLVAMTAHERAAELSRAVLQVCRDGSARRELALLMTRFGTGTGSPRSLQVVGRGLAMVESVRRSTITRLLGDLAMDLANTSLTAAGFVVNAMPSSRVGAASGSINTLMTSGLPPTTRTPVIDRQESGLIMHIIDSPASSN